MKLQMRWSQTTIQRHTLIKQIITDYFFTKKVQQTMQIKYSAEICINKEWQIATVKTTFTTQKSLLCTEPIARYFIANNVIWYFYQKLVIYFITKFIINIFMAAQKIL